MPLRKELYGRLNDVPELGGVIIAHEGESMGATIEVVDGRNRLHIKEHGETYRVNCPYCGDSRHRLWINHRWGYYDKDTRSNNLWLAYCFNAGCLQEYERQRALYNLVFSDGRPRGGDNIEIGEFVDLYLPVAEMPGDVTPLHQLPMDHPANRYILSRGHDPVELGKYLGVGYCDNAVSDHYAARGRIIIPIVMRGDLVGWQARCIGNPPNRNVPKYHTMKGLKKKRVLYNYDRAVASPFVVICEGPTDVWKFGPEAVAMLGKKVSAAQLQMFIGAWKHFVILLDGDALDEIQELADAFIGTQKTTLIESVIPVILPADRDPGDFDTQYLRTTVRVVAASKGVHLPI